jgi:DNA-binding NarL/FixJ family response regulator
MLLGTAEAQVVDAPVGGSVSLGLVERESLAAPTEPAVRPGAVRRSTETRAGGDTDGLEVITVTIAGSEAPFRAGIRAALEAGGFAVVGESDNVMAAIAQTVAMQPDICLIDVGMRGDGLNAVSAISRQSPGTTIVVLGGSPDNGDLVAALQRGASGYLLRTIAADELTKSLRATRVGEPALSRAMVPALIRQVRGRPQRRISMPTGSVELTIREWDVAELLRDGLNTVEISRRLGISPVTVRRHLASVSAKLGTSDRKATVRVLRLFAR